MTVEGCTLLSSKILCECSGCFRDRYLALVELLMLNADTEEQRAVLANILQKELSC